MADEVPPVSGDFEVGTEVAGYLVREQVGWGGMAAVYRAYEVRLGRWVALKILAPEIASDASFRRRFISESRAAAAVDHPHIIPVFEAGEADGVLFIAMRYVDGGDVRMLVRRLGPLDAARACRIIGQVASALDAAHAAGLVHRDVRPANMLLATAGDGYPDHVYLADFGLSRQAGPAARPGAGGQADLCALACAAYEMLAGEASFRRADDLALLGAQLAGPPPPLASLRPDLPPAVDLVLARAMAGSPDDRYESCRDFAASLLQACGLDWGASGQLLADSPGAAVPLGAPLVTAGPAATQDNAAELWWPLAQLPPPAQTLPPARPLPSARQLAPARTLPPAWPLAPALPLTGAVLMADPARPATRQPGLAGLGLATGGPDGLRRGGPGPYSSPPPRRSPVIAVAVIVVLLAIAGAAVLALRDGGARPSRQAAHALRSVAASPAARAGRSRPGHRGSPASAGHSGSPASASQAARPGSTSQAGRPGSASNPGRTRKPGDSGRHTSRRTGRRSPAARGGPAATVSAYIAAINRHDYAKAWHLGGRNSSASYAAFVQGFGTTARDTLIILSVSGSDVNVELVAQQTDGSVKTYQGTYTVDGGVIINSDVDQIS